MISRLVWAFVGCTWCMSRDFLAARGVCYAISKIYFFSPQSPSWYHWGRIPMHVNRLLWNWSKEFIWMHSLKEFRRTKILCVWLSTIGMRWFWRDSPEFSSVIWSFSYFSERPVWWLEFILSVIFPGLWLPTSMRYFKIMCGYQTVFSGMKA